MAKQIKISKANTFNNMANRYEKQGQGKMVNAYGAIGTLIQTFNNGSLMIEPFDKWQYYQFLLNSNNAQTDLLYLKNPEFIQDDRLRARLKTTPGIALNHLIGLFRLPEKEDNKKIEDTPKKTISARFFSKWFYCPQCNHDNLRHFSQLKVNDNPQYPYCAEHHLKKEQFSFLLASQNGEIADIPWREFLTGNGLKIRFILNDAANDALHLTFKTGGSAEDIGTKSVTAIVDGNSITKSLISLPTTKFIDNTGNEYKMIVRQGNNVCFVQTISSVYIPKYTIPLLEINSISMLRTAGIHNAAVIYNLIQTQYQGTQTSLEHIRDFLRTINLSPEDKNIDYKKDEYDFIITAQNSYNDPHDPEKKPRLSFERKISNKLGIKNLYKINRITVTHLQTGYTRLTPDGNTSKKIFSEGANVKYYPAVEMSGEGIFLELDKVQLNVFLNELGADREAHQMANLVHSLSHCILKELEFECGYQLNSLKERLYFDVEKINDTEQVKYAGILIYTASGSNASFGGHSSLFDKISLTIDTMRIEKLIEYAFIRAQDCPNDPICIDEETNGNIGTCYSCNLISEPSCEQFNKGLNRRLLNDFYVFILRQQALQ